MKKLREFYCTEFKWRDGRITYTPGPEYNEEQGNRAFLVREVCPEIDAAIEKMVKALEAQSAYRGGHYSVVEVDEALAAWRKAME